MSSKLPSYEACIQQEHIMQAIKASHETAPGPDGIPYKAFKKLGAYAASFLHDVAEDLQEPGAAGTPAASFNYAILCCLPKKASRVDEKYGEVYEPSKTRPLSIVNTDNRLIANAYRIMFATYYKFQRERNQRTIESW